MSTVIALIVSDLMFQSRIEAAAKALGFDVRVPNRPDEVAALEPALVVIDLHEREGDPLRAIREARASGAKVLAFGRHTEPGTLRAAREAGADAAVPRSQLVEELPKLLSSLAGSPATEAG